MAPPPSCQSFASGQVPFMKGRGVTPCPDRSLIPGKGSGRPVGTALGCNGFPVLCALRAFRLRGPDKTLRAEPLPRGPRGVAEGLRWGRAPAWFLRGGCAGAPRFSLRLPVATSCACQTRRSGVGNLIGALAAWALSMPFSGRAAGFVHAPADSGCGIECLLGRAASVRRAGFAAVAAPGGGRRLDCR